jgi:catechol 2,3-dioxygenase-like lactoylglutathione lyase family enzyme
MLERLMIPVTDIERSRIFYERVFGFITLGGGRAAANGSGTLEMRAPGAPLAVTLIDAEAGMPVGSLQGAILEVGDLAKARAHIAAQGMSPPNAVQGPQGAHFEVHDPDGNGWIIRQV